MHNNEITKYIILGFKKLNNIIRTICKDNKSTNINFSYICKKLDNFIT